MSVVVVYVHGLWMPGAEGLLLRRRLGTRLGAETRAFTYRSVNTSVTDNAVGLSRYLNSIPADTLHLVGHSLGGLVILRMFEPGGEPQGRSSRDTGLPPGRIVLLGSPVNGSVSAERFARWPLGGSLIGAGAGEALLARRARHWAGGRDLGVIAGDMPLGMGRLLGRMEGPNDGTVLVSETVLAGAAAQLRLRVSHMGLPYSRRVADETATFLRDGRFGMGASRG
jgi:pimeloyl-ACP methyl ester carboxylesterase